MKPDLTRPVDFTTYNGTDKVCTRAGWPWRSLGRIKQSLFIVIGSVMHPNGFETVYGWDDKGRMDQEERDHDLFYALPEKVEKTFWVAIAPFEIDRGRLNNESILYSSKKEALSIGYGECIQIVPITLLVEE